MPLRVTDQIHWCLSTPGLRWARQPRKGLPRGKDSADLIGSSRQRPTLRGFRPPGARAGWLGNRPRLVYLANDITSERKRFWSIRPQGTSAKNWSLEFSDERSGSRHQLEWIAQGFTAVSFWTAPWRSITGLEDRFRFWPMSGLGTARLSPNRCLAGLPAAAKALARQAMSELPKEIKPEFPF